jgi:hypothetical protein
LAASPGTRQRADPADIPLMHQSIGDQFRNIPALACLELFQDIDVEDEFCLGKMARAFLAEVAASRFARSVLK